MTCSSLPRRNTLKAGAAMGAALLTGCSPFTLVNGLTPADGYHLSGDIAYGGNPRQRLDVYRPTGARRNAAVIVFFYGGNWDEGDRRNYRFVGAALASAGFVTVVPDYRLFPEVRFPGFLDDCAAAVRWTTDRIAAFGGDAGSLYLMGHSAGAYNAAMLALDERYLRDAGVARGAVQGLIGLAGPYDFLPLQSPITRAVFGYPNTPLETQPIHYASATSPRALLVAGSSDDVVDPGNATRLAARLHDAGGRATVRIYPAIGHRLLIGALAAPLREFVPVLDDVVRFVDRPRPVALLQGAAASNVWNFRVLLDDAPVGHHRFTVIGQGAQRELRSEARFTVRMLFVTIHRYSHDATEQWHDDCLVGLDAITDDNGARTMVHAALDEEGHLDVVNGRGRSSLDGCVMSFAYWNPRILRQSRLLNAQTGNYDPVSVARVGEERISVRGEVMEAQRYRITGPGKIIDLWYSAAGAWLALESIVAGGHRLRYQLEI